MDNNPGQGNFGPPDPKEFFDQEFLDHLKKPTSDLVDQLTEVLAQADYEMNDWSGRNDSRWEVVPDGIKTAQRHRWSHVAQQIDKLFTKETRVYPDTSEGALVEQRLVSGWIVVEANNNG